MNGSKFDIILWVVKVSKPNWHLELLNEKVKLGMKLNRHKMAQEAKDARAM